MKARVFWPLVFALSLLNFGIDLVVAGTNHLSGWELMVMTGSWLVLGAIGILVWLISGRRNGMNGNKGH
jgi:hypothetical protein